MTSYTRLPASASTEALIQQIESQKRKRTLSSATELFSSGAPAKMHRPQIAMRKNTGRGIEDLGVVTMPMGVVQTQGLELFALQWFREVAGQAKEMAGATQETAINLCKLVTQENEWARVYTGCAAKVLEEKIGQEEEEKKEEEE